MKTILQKYNPIFVLAIYILLAFILIASFGISFTTEIIGHNDAFEILAYPNEVINKFSDNGHFGISAFGSYLVSNVKSILDLKTCLLLLQLAIGEPWAYNLIWIASFILSAWGAYLLVRYITKNNSAAFISGIIYSGASIHFAHGLGHLGATHIEWIPFFVLFLLKYFNKPSLKYILLSILFFTIIVANEPHYDVYTSLLALLIGIYYLVTKRRLLRNKKFIIISSVAILLGLVIVFVSYSSLFDVYFSDDNYLKPAFEESIKYSADLVSPLFPIMHPVWGDFFNNITGLNAKNISETALYVGIPTLILAILLIIYKKNKEQKNSAIFWFFIFATFYILSLGPFLHVFGEIISGFRLPYYYFHEYIPFVDNIRTTSRVFVISSLAISILAGIGLSLFLDKLQNKKSRVLLIIALSAIILIDLLVIPNTSSIAVNPFYESYFLMLLFYYFLIISFHLQIISQQLQYQFQNKIHIIFLVIVFLN